jgi:hypothetical protein
LQAHFHFFANAQSKKKNVKELASYRTGTLQNMTRQSIDGRRRAACNSTYKKLAVQWLNEASCFVSSSVLADSFRLRNRQLLVAAKRYRAF